MTGRLTAEDVAGRYRLSVDRFRKRRAALEAAGFPKPLPGFDHLLWNERHLEVWEALAQGGDLRDQLLKIMREDVREEADPRATAWQDELRHRMAVLVRP